jgi:hypothetical protein
MLCIKMYVYMYVYIIYIYTYIYIQACIRAQMRTWVALHNAHKCICVCVCTYTCTRAHMRT